MGQENVGFGGSVGVHKRDHNTGLTCGASLGACLASVAAILAESCDILATIS